jgi:hypothetical protein
MPGEPCDGGLGEQQDGDEHRSDVLAASALACARSSTLPLGSHDNAVGPVSCTRSRPACPSRENRFMDYELLNAAAAIAELGAGSELTSRIGAIEEALLVRREATRHEPSRIMRSMMCC